MRAKSILTAMVLCILLVHRARGELYDLHYNDGAVHSIVGVDGPYGEDTLWITVDDPPQAPSASTTVIYSGAYASRLFAFNNSDVIINDDSSYIYSLWAHDNSSLTINEGGAEYLHAVDDSHVTLNNGAWGALHAFVTDNGCLTMNGGYIDMFEASGQVTMNGGELACSWPSTPL